MRGCIKKGTELLNGVVFCKRALKLKILIQNNRFVCYFGSTFCKSYIKVKKLKAG